MTNFNHERMGIIIQCIRFSRVCYEESMKYAHKRRTFGKKLIEHPVIRLKLAHMVTTSPSPLAPAQRKTPNPITPKP
jgi:alkylation response protein AidB-like acyl-CoA dehydrogenase